MFDVWCPRHSARVLLFPAAIDAVVNTDAGIEVHWRCPCGERGVWLTGVTRSAADAADTARAENLPQAAAV